MKQKISQPTDLSTDRRSTLVRGFHLCAFLFVTLTAIFAAGRMSLIFPLGTQNGEFLASTYKMKEDDFSNPRLQLLRRREHLDDVMAAGKTQFEKIVLLRKWAHEQWPAGSCFYYPAWDAVEILDLARQHKNFGFCAQYAIVFLQACQSVGIHARYVELPGHFLVGVWSDDYDRWVIMDPSSDVHYEKDGLPLRGGALCRAYWTHSINGITKVGSDGSRIPVTQDDLGVYRMYSIVERADQLADPPLVQVNGSQWKKLDRQPDYRNYPYVGRDQVGLGSPYLAWRQSGAKEYFENKRQSDDPDDFNYVLNQCMLFVARRRPDKGLVKVVLYAEDSPTFGTFQIKVDNGKWQPLNSREVGWQLKPGKNTLASRIHTKFGWDGPTSTLSMYYKPRWF